MVKSVIPAVKSVEQYKTIIISVPANFQTSSPDHVSTGVNTKTCLFISFIKTHCDFTVTHLLVCNNEFDHVAHRHILGEELSLDGKGWMVVDLCC